jgi:hypothetical protein
MKKKNTKNILYVCATGLLIVAIMVNINLAKQNVDPILLTLDNLAFTGENDNNNNNIKGPATPTNVDCTITRKTVSYNTSNAAHSAWSALGASIRASIEAFLLAASGSAASNASAEIQGLPVNIRTMVISLLLLQQNSFRAQNIIVQVKKMYRVILIIHVNKQERDYYVTINR